MRKIILFSSLMLAVLLFVNAAEAQNATAGAKNSDFDADLAKKLGADKYGMKNYVLVILKTGPKDSTITGKERDDLFAGHLANIRRLADAGKLALAGPFGKNDKQFRGLFIFNVTTIDEARALVESDPTIKAGVLIADFVPWYGSAALMETNALHKKIAETSF